jgi:hypothetical protein
VIVHWFYIGNIKCTYINGTPSEVANNLMKSGVPFVEVVEVVE